MFGTDEALRKKMYHNYFRWLDEDEYFPYAQYPAQGGG